MIKENETVNNVSKKTLIYGVISILFGSDFVFADGILPNSPEVMAAGEASYKTNCLMCHGANGDGSGPAGALMNPKPRSFGDGKFSRGGKPEELFQTITNGMDGTAMAAFKHLSVKERSGLVYYILKMKK